MAFQEGSGRTVTLTALPRSTAAHTSGLSLGLSVPVSKFRSVGLVQGWELEASSLSPLPIPAPHRTLPHGTRTLPQNPG